MEASRNKPDGQRHSTGIRTVAFHVVDPGLSLGTTYSPKHIALRIENKETTEIKAVMLGGKRDSEPTGDSGSHTMCHHHPQAVWKPSVPCLLCGLQETSLPMPALHPERGHPSPLMGTCPRLHTHHTISALSRLWQRGPASCKLLTQPQWTMRKEQAGPWPTPQAALLFPL